MGDDVLGVSREAGELVELLAYAVKAGRWTAVLVAYQASDAAS